jgi:hypothetical protein
MTETDLEILYIGTAELRVNLRDGRAAVFTLEEPQRVLPAASAMDLLSPAIGGGRFMRLSKGGA